MGERGDILVVIAHPDDEIFVSGTMCLCADSGFGVALACATNGEGGSSALSPRSSRLQLGEVRRRELALSAWVLGAQEPIFLNQPDIHPDHWKGSASWNERSLVDALAKIIEQQAPTAILTHGPRGGYGHPAHQLLHGCVMAAARGVAFSGSIFSFCGQVDGAFFSWHFDQPSDVLVDVRGFVKRRSASLGYHQSQSDFFLEPGFPKTARKCLSALYGLVFRSTVAGRKRVPIGTPERFFRRFPIEGLALHQAGQGGHFFRDHFAADSRVRSI